MSIHTDVEVALQTLMEANITDYGNTSLGPITQPQVEGSERRAAVRFLSGRSSRLDYGQSEWSDTYAVTAWWSHGIARSDIVTEWQAFADALLADQYLGGAIVGVQDTYLAAANWSEPHDGAFRTVSAEIQTVRVE